MEWANAIVAVLIGSGLVAMLYQLVKVLTLWWKSRKHLAYPTVQGYFFITVALMLVMIVWVGYALSIFL